MGNVYFAMLSGDPYIIFILFFPQFCSSDYIISSNLSSIWLTVLLFY
jgi:hypothetical protein